MYTILRSLNGVQSGFLHLTPSLRKTASIRFPAHSTGNNGKQSVALFSSELTMSHSNRFAAATSDSALATFEGLYHCQVFLKAPLTNIILSKETMTTEHSTADTAKTPEESNVVQSVEADNAAMLSSPKKEKILPVTVHLKNPTVFTLGYRSHDELYRRFQEKLNALGIPLDQIYLEDTMTGERLRIDRSMAEAWFFSWENWVDLYSPIYPVNELALFPLPTRHRHHHNHDFRHRSIFSSSSSSCGYESRWAQNRHGSHYSRPSCHRFPFFPADPGSAMCPCNKVVFPRNFCSFDPRFGCSHSCCCGG